MKGGWAFADFTCLQHRLSSPITSAKMYFTCFIGGSDCTLRFALPSDAGNSCAVGRALNVTDYRVYLVSYHYALSVQPLVRVMKSCRRSVALVELRDLLRFNMMSSQLSAWFGMATFCSRTHAQKPAVSGVSGLTLSGASLHFCPGGYVGTRQTMSESTYVMYRCFVSLRNIGLFATCVLHGVVVGGGVALSLHTNVRLSPAASTLSFGNLSRGAVPGMRLSMTLPRVDSKSLA